MNGASSSQKETAALGQEVVLKSRLKIWAILGIRHTVLAFSSFINQLLRASPELAKPQLKSWREESLPHASLEPVGPSRVASRK
jgi:hypothetical protein